MRIGVLGAARITPTALVRPASKLPGVEVAAVAARDRGRAEAFAAKHGIATVHDDYQSLIDDSSLDAVYVPLPNHLHATWTLAALRAGRHVLCEKPFTANAAEAREVAAAAGRAGMVVMEAFHYRYHPLARRMAEIVHGGELGEISHVETTMCVPLPRFSDIRYRYELAGGALMDVGCYAVHCLRLLAPGNPVVTGARAEVLRRDRRVDRAMTATFRFATGATGRIRASMWSSTLLRVRATVVGDRGTLRVSNYAIPALPYRFMVAVDRPGSGPGMGRRSERRYERFDSEPTYVHQLRAFAAAVSGTGGDAAGTGATAAAEADTTESAETAGSDVSATANLTPPEDSVATMALIDGIYTAAGLPLRGQPATTDS